MWKNVRIEGGLCGEKVSFITVGLNETNVYDCVNDRNRASSGKRDTWVYHEILHPLGGV